MVSDARRKSIIIHILTLTVCGFSVALNEMTWTRHREIIPTERRSNSLCGTALVTTAIVAVLSRHPRGPGRSRRVHTLCTHFRFATGCSISRSCDNIGLCSVRTSLSRLALCATAIVASTVWIFCLDLVSNSLIMPACLRCCLVVAISTAWLSHRSQTKAACVYIPNRSQWRRRC